MNPRADRRSRGSWAEDVAARYLAEHGLVCRDRNFRSRYGEIDLVMGGRRGAGVRRGPFPAAGRASWTRPRAWTGPSAPASRGPRTPGSAPGAARRSPPAGFDVVAVTGEPAAPGIRWVRDAFDA